MSIKFATESMGRSEAKYVDFPENILIEPELNGRHEHTDIEDLAADIEKNGQMSPIGIRKNDDGAPVVIYGHRRYRAISLLNERNPSNPRKIICNYHNVDASEAFAMAIAENRFRRDVSPIDDCANIVMLRKRFAMTDEDIARIYFPESRTEDEKTAALKFVKDRAALEELAPESAQAVRDGRVKLTAAKGLAKLSKAQQRDKLKAAGDGKLKGKDLASTPAKAAPKRAASDDKTLLKLARALFKDLTKPEIFNEEYSHIPTNRDALKALFLHLHPEAE